MNKFTKKRLIEIKKDIQLNFSEIIDYIIFYDSQDEDLKGWDLIYKIEELEHDKEINLILADFNKRDLTNSSTLLYNSIIYGLVNNEESKEVLLKVLKENKTPNFEAYLTTLDKKNGREGDLNIEDIMSKLNENSSNRNKL